MSLERWLFGSAIYSTYHLLKGDQVKARIAEFEANQWRSPAEIAALQEGKLRALIRHAASNVPYYRQFVAAGRAGTFAAQDLCRLPALTKAAIRKAGDELRAMTASDSDLEANSTSGSTGEPLYFYTDLRSSDCRKATVVRSNRWAGIQCGDREIRLWGSPMDIGAADALRGRLHGWLTRSKMLSAYEISPETLREYLRVMQKYRPNLLIAYPSVLVELAQEAEKLNVNLPELRAIIVSAETLYPFQRELFEKVFGVPIFNRYGSREVGDIAQECIAHDGLHINADRILVEVVRPDLSQCAAGEVGDILVTDLENFGMPLIRYAIGDRGSLSSVEVCACGRSLPRLATIEGRSLDVIRFPSGSAVGGTYWTILLRKNPGIEQFQVLQSSANGVVIRYVAETDLAPEVVRYICSDVLRRAGSEFAVTFERVSQIPVNRAGKRRLVIRELSA